MVGIIAEKFPATSAGTVAPAAAARQTIWCRSFSGATGDAVNAAAEVQGSSDQPVTPAKAGVQFVAFRGFALPSVGFRHSPE
jgi:hypothetical protein